MYGYETLVSIGWVCAKIRAVEIDINVHYSWNEENNWKNENVRRVCGAKKSLEKCMDKSFLK